MHTEFDIPVMPGAWELDMPVILGAWELDIPVMPGAWELDMSVMPGAQKLDMTSYRGLARSYAHAYVLERYRDAKSKVMSLVGSHLFGSGRN